MTIIRKGFGDVFEFSRAGSATYWGADGKLHVAGPDEPRFHYDPVTGEALGLLVEGVATNYALHSNNLADSSWGKQGINATLVTDPKFPFPVSRVECAVQEENRRGFWQNLSSVDEHFGTIGAPSIRGFVVKAGTHRYVALGTGSTSTGTNLNQPLQISLTVVFDMLSGAFLEEGGVGRALSLGAGWYFIYGAYDTASGSQYNTGLSLRLVDADGWNNTSAEGDYFYVANAVAFKGDEVYSQIVTEDAPVTRPADILTRTLQAPEYNPSEGTMLLRANTKSETIYLDGLSPNGIEATDGEGTLVYTYDEDGGLVYAPNTEYGDDGPPENPELNVAQGNTDLRLLAYYPRKFTPEEARLNAQGSLVVPEWNPSFLFKNGEVGVWFDPSDLDTVFQDANGTTPGELGQPVGLILDKSKGLELGPELVVDGDFSEGLTNWTVGNAADAQVSGGVVTFTSQGRASSSNNNWLSPDLTTSVPEETVLEVSFSAKHISGVDLSVSSAYTSMHTISASENNGETKNYKFKYAVSYSNVNYPIPLAFSSAITAESVWEISNVSIREIPGHHASQPTTTARPILGREPKSGRTNLLDWSEDFTEWGQTNVTVTNSGPSGMGFDWYEVKATASTERKGIYLGPSTLDNEASRTIRVAIKKGTQRYVKITTAGTSQLNGYIAVVDMDTLEFEYVSPQASNLDIEIIGPEEIIVSYRVQFNLANNKGVDIGFVLAGYDGVPSTYFDYETDGTETFYVGFAQHNDSPVGSAFPTYQKTQANGYDITEEGVDDVYYLAFDGVDDWLELPKGLDLQNGMFCFGLANAESGVCTVFSGGSAGYLTKTNKGWGRNQGGTVVTAVPIKNPQVVSWQMDNSTSPITTVVTDSTGESGEANSTANGLGSMRYLLKYVPDSTNPFRVDIYGIVIRESRLSKRELETLMAHLDQKTGITHD